jgi:Lar family restriction alleviation protein
MTDLLPCPFCGTAEAQAAVVSAGGIEWGQVECSCGATVSAGASVADATAVWNTRALTRPVVERVARAICAASGLGTPDDLMGQENYGQPGACSTRPYRWEQHIHQASAAIEAMRR